MAKNGTVNNVMKKNLEQAAMRYTSICDYEDMRKLTANFLSSNGLTRMGATGDKLILQEKLLEHIKVMRCPHCGKRHIVKAGTQKSTGLICFKCMDCGRKFNIFTGTVSGLYYFHS